MILFTELDRQMLKHVVEVFEDRMLTEGGYTEQNEDTVTKLEKLAKTSTTAVVVTGDERDAESHSMFREIVKAELGHWVPNASQRLLYRAGRIIGIDQPDPAKGLRDCGPDRAHHALISDWVAGLYLYRCVNCFRLFDA